MAIQRTKEIENSVSLSQPNQLRVSLDSVQKNSLKKETSSIGEIHHYAHDAYRSIFVGALIIILELCLYFFKVFK